MKQEEDIKTKYGKDSGMRVPEGFFETFEKEVMSKLPPYPQHESPILSRWQRVRPYVYLAAMFCGIWLMMKVFHTATQPATLSLDNPPQALVELMQTEDTPDYIYYSYTPDEDLDIDDEDFIMSYDNIEDFEKDFGYEIKPEYASIPATDNRSGQKS